MAGPHHRTAEHRRNAKAAVARANADPNYRCPRCGELRRADDPWEGGHLDRPDGTPDYTSPRRRAEHRSCNRKHGLLFGQGIVRPQAEEPRRTELTWSIDP